jgi:hypothetical protein
MHKYQGCPITRWKFFTFVSIVNGSECLIRHVYHSLIGHSRLSKQKKRVSGLERVKRIHWGTNFEEDPRWNRLQREGSSMKYDARGRILEGPRPFPSHRIPYSLSTLKFKTLSLKRRWFYHVILVNQQRVSRGGKHSRVQGVFG